MTIIEIGPEPMPPHLNNDLSNWWMPFTNNRHFKAAPRMLVAAKGMYYTTADGRQLLDAAAALWCVNAGHGRESIASAIGRQAIEMDFAPSFQFGHPLGFTLASRLAELLPGDLNRIFFANSGSEAVDSALKIALAYHRVTGNAARTRLIGRERGYHGVGFGGMSVGGISGNRKLYGSMLGGVDHLPHTHDLSRAFTRGQPETGAHLADELDRIVSLHDASTIAAVIVEPLAGSTGVLPPPVGYLQRLREICTKHGILLIFDEVISGFGRLGTGFACERFGVLPDMVVMAKGLTNGVIPMGAVAVRQGLYDRFLEASADGIELPHGYTYSGHPVAAAAALASLDIYQQEDLFGRARNLSPSFEQAVHGLRDARHVIDIRNLGLVAGIELAPSGKPGARGMAMLQYCFDNGLLVRVTGDTIALSPPLIIEEGQIDQIMQTLRDGLAAIE